MLRQPPRSTLPDTLFPYPPLFRPAPRRVARARTATLGAAGPKEAPAVARRGLFRPPSCRPPVRSRSETAARAATRRPRQAAAGGGVEASDVAEKLFEEGEFVSRRRRLARDHGHFGARVLVECRHFRQQDRKSTRLNSSH